MTVQSASVTVGAFGAQGPSSPGLRIRVLIPARRLATTGIRVEPRPLFTAVEAARFADGTVPERARMILGARHRMLRKLDGRTEQFDAVLIQRQVDMLASLRLERAVAGDGRLIYDVDDAIWVDARRGGGHALAALKGSRRKMRWLASNAEHVIAGNEILAERLATYSERVTIVPSLIDTELVTPRVHEVQSSLVLGWIGSPTTAIHMPRLRTVLTQVARAFPGRSVRVMMVGGEMPAPAGVDLDTLPWNERNEQLVLRAMDVGLMPLADNEWTRGKCAYKALQYMAAGVPVVADDVGMTAKVIGDDAGVAARNEAEWTEALVSLLRDASLRNEMGKHGRERVEQGFSVKSWAPTLSAIMRGA
jgi:glycosyltransferase involved in cell wall biosynthesis